MLYSTHGIIITVVAAAVVFVAITLTRVLEYRPMRWLLAPLAHRPAFPAAGVFLTAVAAAALASLYINTLTGPPPGWFINVSYATGIALVVLFTLTSGSVIYPRVHSTRLIGSAEIQETSYAAWWRRIQARTAEFNYIARLEYSSGFRPTTRNRDLIWKVPAQAKPGELETRFEIWHDKSRWRLGGRIFLVGGEKCAPAGSGRCVHVRLSIGSGLDLRPIDMDVLTGAEPVQLNYEQPGTSDILRVALWRIDSSAEDVLLCWLRAGGTIDRPWLEGRALTADEQPGTG